MVLTGGDLLAGAQTGAGKTAGFVLPMLQRLSANAPPARARGTGIPIRCLILTPTRELAAQVEESVRIYGKYMTKLSSMVIFGGVGMQPQIDRLKRGVDILVATPGRLLDHAGQRIARPEPGRDPRPRRGRPHADMGFLPDEPVLALLPQKKQRAALLGDLQRRDQGARRPAAQQPG